MYNTDQLLFNKACYHLRAYGLGSEGKLIDTKGRMCILGFLYSEHHDKIDLWNMKTTQVIFELRKQYHLEKSDYEDYKILFKLMIMHDQLATKLVNKEEVNLEKELETFANQYGLVYNENKVEEVSTDLTTQSEEEIVNLS